MNQKEVLTFLLTVYSLTVFAQTPVFENEKYSIYQNKIIQERFTAEALTKNKIISDYQSPANLFQSRDITFKFSINGKDNEMISGSDHHYTIRENDSGVAETPLIQFGKQLNDVQSSNNYLAPNTKLVIRLDMRHVLKAFDEKGYYTTFNGEQIYKEDFKNVFVGGGTSPFTWDFDNLIHHPDLELTDPDHDGIYEVTIVLNKHSANTSSASAWELTKDISSYPQYQSGYLITDALYNLSMEEMLKAIEPDSTFRTGKEWSGVWTRDISYSIILSMAYLQPNVARYSLLKKVNKDKRIIQDTGTGGAWPVSSDRMIWAVAAWEVYTATRDENWLRQAYEIISNSIKDDYHTLYDAETGLVRGESSFLDWREQTYPRWMQPADIFESECLGTNAVHYQANRVLSEMAKELGDISVSKQCDRVASKIKSGINKYLWMEDKGYYGQYRYGRNYKTLSSRSESLGEALCVLFDIASAKQQTRIIERTPVSDFGIPCLYPQIPNIPPYHNDAVWPFVQSYWVLAAAKAGNDEAVAHGMSAVYRASGLFLTNKENLVASTGDFMGTQINSDNMLWSISGSIALVHKVLFGIGFQKDGLSFNPFVPEVYKGKRWLINFKFRNAVLDIEMEGFGNTIQSFVLDGKVLQKPVVPESITGRHTIKIILANNKTGSEINNAPVSVTPETPVISLNDDKLLWNAVPNAVKYNILYNGKHVSTVSEPGYKIGDNTSGEYQVAAVDKNNDESFASEPVPYYSAAQVIKVELEDLLSPSDFASKGFSGKGFVETSKQKNNAFTVTVSVPKAGRYAIDFKYANGNGPVNTDNKCAIRTVRVNDVTATVVLPQRGLSEWSDWGFSNSVDFYLKKGDNRISLTLDQQNNNMDGEINQAMLDFIRLTYLKK